jgi:hypothetical protein
MLLGWRAGFGEPREYMANMTSHAGKPRHVGFEVRLVKLASGWSEGENVARVRFDHLAEGSAIR